MASPDGLIRWYYTVGEDLGAPGIDYVKSRGRVYLKVCGSTSKESRRRRGNVQGPCPSKLRHLTAEGEYVCGRCGAVWRYRDRFALRGEVQESVRSGSFEDAKSRWVDVGVQLAQFLEDPGFRWESRLYVANVCGHSVRDLVKYGPTWFPEANFPWHRDGVHKRVVVGREEWTRRLAVAEIAFD